MMDTGKRGRTGQEGGATKLFGAAAALIGLAWGGATYFLSENWSPLFLPALLLIAGAITFFVGRSMAGVHSRQE